MSYFTKKNVQEPLLLEGGDENTPLVAAEKPADDGVLTRQQINQCMMDIEDNHPLYEIAKFQHILPAFQRCMKPPKQDFKTSLRMALLKELQLKVPKTDKKIAKNPFLLLGYGVNSYFNVLSQLMKMFAFITIFFLPVMFLYHNNHQQQLGNQPGMAYMVSSLSLGNMGGAVVNCHQNKLVFNAIDLHCPVGRIHTKGLMKYGIISDQVTNQIYCEPETLAEYVVAHTKNATNTGDKYIYGPSTPYVNCSAHIDHESVEKNINDKCENQTSCEIQFDNLYLPEYDRTKANMDGTCGNEAAFYIQYPCLIPARFKEPRQLAGLFIGCITVFIYLFVLVYLDYIKCKEMNEFVEFDVDTITAGDYTVTFDLEEDTYNRFKDIYYDKKNSMCENAQFKLYLQNELQERVTALPDQGYREPEQQGDPIKIAQITFAYENGWIIDQLKKRGAAIGSEKYDKVAEINAEIHTRLTTDEAFLNKCQLPCAVFCTFEDEEGYNRADDIADSGIPQMKLLGEAIQIRGAAEPTDIIWENREYSPHSRRVRTAIAWFIILIMLTISFLFIFSASVYGNKAKNMFPAAKCSAVEKQWYGLQDKLDDPHAWQNAAVKNYASNLPAYNSGEQTYYTDVWPCFCAQKNMNGKKFDARAEFGMIPADKKVGGKTVTPAKICEIHAGIKYMGLAVASSISFVIIAINIVLKKIVVALLTWVKEPTKSQMLASNTNGVFIVLFLNTGLLLTVANANLTEHPPHFITNIFKGPYYDYEPEWYAQVGFLILKTMIINAFMPFVGLATGYFIPKLKRKMDMKWGSDRYVTKKTSMIAYKKVWSGGEYIMHVKDSGILLIVFVTAMYGVGMPLLFPVAAFNFCNQFLCERIMACYQVKLPPALDDRLTNNMLSMMKWAPLIMLFNGYWMLSNRQIFANTWSYVPNSASSTSMKSDHFITFSVNWAIPVLLMAMCAVFLILFIRIVPNHYRMKWGFSLQQKEIEVDEDLPNFFETILLSQADELVNEEKNLKLWYGIECNDPDTVSILDEAKQPKRSIMGTPWYTVLSNDQYKEDFAYIGGFVEEREKLIEDDYEPEFTEEEQEKRLEASNLDKEGGMTNEERDAEWILRKDERIKCEQSDLVILLLNIACVPDSVVVKIPDFNHGWSQQFLKLIENYKQTEYEGEGDFKFQNSDLEDMYAKFVQEKQSKDDLYIKDKKEHDADISKWEIKNAKKEDKGSNSIN